MIKLHSLTKLYYSIGEVAELFGIAPSQIRYWESEFVQLKPAKNNRGERKYTKKEIEIISDIHELLKNKGFTIEGARKELVRKKEDHKESDTLIKRLKKLREQLVKMRESLDEA
jgi:DNA-binding transcriptional MerR regulator